MSGSPPHPDLLGAARSVLRDWRQSKKPDVSISTMPATPTPWATSLRVSLLGEPDDVVVRLVDRSLLDPVAIAVEFEAAIEASRLGVGPEVLFCDHSRGALVMRWIEGTTSSPPALERAAQTVELLRVWHDRGPIPAIDLERRKTASALTSALDAVERGALPSGFGWAARTHRLLTTHADLLGADPTPLHNDLNPTNVLVARRRSWLIDFDYVGSGDPLFDVATVILSCGLEGDEAVSTVARYLGRPADDTELSRLRLHRARCLLRYAFTTATLVDARPEEDLDALFPPGGRAFVFETVPGGSHREAIGRLSMGFLTAATKELVADGSDADLAAVGVDLTRVLGDPSLPQTSTVRGPA